MIPQKKLFIKPGKPEVSNPRGIFIVAGIMIAMAIVWVAGIPMPVERGEAAILYAGWLFVGGVFGYLVHLGIGP